MPEATTSTAVAEATQPVVDEVIDRAFVESQLGGNHLSTPAPPVEEAEETPAEESTETPVEEAVEEAETAEAEAETPAEVEVETPVPVAQKPALAAAKKEETTAPPPVAAKVDDKSSTETAKDIRAERKRVNAKLAELRKQLDGKEELDAVDDAKLLKEINSTLLESAQLQDQAIDVVDDELIQPKKQEEATEAYWDKWGADHPEHNAELAVDAWEDCLLEAGKRFKSDDAINGFATALFESRLDGLKKNKIAPKPNATPAKVAAATAPKPTVTKGAAQVVPKGTQPARAAQRELTNEELIDKGMVDFSDLARIIGR